MALFGPCAMSDLSPVRALSISGLERLRQTTSRFAPYHDKRDEFSRALQSAAGQAGLQTTHSIRRKTLRRS
jgi:hypothetical protein